MRALPHFRGWLKTIRDNAHCLRLGYSSENRWRQCILLRLRKTHIVWLVPFPFQWVRKELWACIAWPEAASTVDTGFMNSPSSISSNTHQIDPWKEDYRFLPISLIPEAHSLICSFRIVTFIVSLYLHKRQPLFNMPFLSWPSHSLSPSLPSNLISAPIAPYS